MAGCADSTREGFVPKEPGGAYVFADIASCAGTFEPQSLRASKTGRTCGNSIGPCVSPADLCADGWHICMNNGWPGDLADRVAEGDCHSGTAGEGSFAAAANTAASCTSNACVYEPLPLPCVGSRGCWYGTATGTLACGGSSTLDGVCTSALWPDNTAGVGMDCNDAASGPSRAVTGVLCCQDPPVVGH